MPKYFALLILLLVSAGAFAATNTALPAGSIDFGDASCRGTVPCTTDYDSMQTIAANATNCSNMNFGVRGFTFDPERGTDSNDCLQATPPSNLVKPTSGLAMTPHCCVVQDGDTCHVQCQLIGAR